MHPLRDLARLVPLSAVLVLWACGTTTEPEDDSDTDAGVGSVTAAVTTTGADLDDGYTVSIGTLSGTVGANASVTIGNVPVGSASVTLGGVAANCDVTSANPASVTVAEGGTATASFTVVCEALMTGDVAALLAEALESLEENMYTALQSEVVADLDNFSFEESNGLFNQVLGIEPSHEVAAFGAAITTIFMLEDNEDVRAAAEEWETWLNEGDEPIVPPLLSPGSALTWERTSLPTDFSGAELERVTRSGLLALDFAKAPTGPELAPPDVTTYRPILLDIVIPALDEALELLSIIEDPDFRFTVTAAMQGEDPAEADPLELDLTEVRIIQAGLDAAAAGAQVFLSYSFEPSPLDSPEDAVVALTPGSTFLQLEDDGGDLLEDALGRIRAAAANLLAALDNLEAETDDQSDDILKIGVDGVDQADIDEAQRIVADVRDALFDPTEIVLNEGYEDEYTLTLDAKQFFLNPPGDLKAIVPPYEVFIAQEADDTEAYLRWQALNIEDWDFPDPTFGGVFPGMTQEELRGEPGLELGEIFYELSIAEGSYRLLSIDDVDCDAVIQAGGQGCELGGAFYSYGYVGLNGYDDEPYGEFYVSSTSGFTSAYGPYTVTEASEDEYDIAMALEDSYTSDPVSFTARLIDMPGYTSYDEFGRPVGGSTLEFSYLGGTWIFVRD